MKEAYALRAKPGQSAYNIALADYMTAPEIAEVDFSTFNGAKGSQVTLQVVDDYEVADVKAALYDTKGVLLEEGSATLHENGIDWVYVTRKAIANPAGTAFKVQASDLPGNKTESEEVFN